MMQAALPCMLFARGRVKLQLRGGTNAAFAPQIDYFMLVSTQARNQSNDTVSVGSGLKYINKMPRCNKLLLLLLFLFKMISQAARSSAACGKAHAKINTKIRPPPL